jgi:hypothetical protein
MTIDQFRSTGRDVPDLGAVIGDEEVTRGQPGRVYCGCFWIAALPERRRRYSTDPARKGWYAAQRCLRFAARISLPH